MARADLVIQAPDIATPQIKELARLVEAEAIAALSAASTQASPVAAQHPGACGACAEAGIDLVSPADSASTAVRLVA